MKSSRHVRTAGVQSVWTVRWSLFPEKKIATALVTRMTSLGFVGCARMRFGSLSCLIPHNLVNPTNVDIPDESGGKENHRDYDCQCYYKLPFHFFVPPFLLFYHLEAQDISD